jgi:hypothetical protein
MYDHSYRRRSGSTAIVYIYIVPVYPLSFAALNCVWQGALNTVQQGPCYPRPTLSTHFNQKAQMKFKLFGGLDCSDFFLAQLDAVAGLEPDVAEWIADHALSVLAYDPRTATTLSSSAAASPAEATSELLNQDKLSHLGPKAEAAVVAIHHLASNIVRYNVPLDSAINEMSMLGLPKEVAEAIANTVCPSTPKLRHFLLEQFPARDSLFVDSDATETWQCTTGVHERTGAETLIRLKAAFPSRSSSTQGPVIVDMSVEQAQALLAELTLARESLRVALAS